MTVVSIDGPAGAAAAAISPAPPFAPTWRVFIPALCVIAAVRSRFIWTPITSDEGGFLAIARSWHRGATLYEDVWVDRPQGLLLLYRTLHLLGLGTPEGVRLLALGACVLGAVACGVIAGELLDARAAGPTAVVVGALTSVPQYEGFIANGELLSGAIGAAGLALAIRACWDRDHPSLGRLFAAGLVAGAAFTVKQSGFDAFACAVAAVSWRSLQRRWTLRQRLVALPTTLAGFGVPVLAMLVHGWVGGWSRFWYAVFGYRTAERSALRDADWDRLWETWRVARPALLPALAVGAVAMVVVAVASRRCVPGVVLIALGWVPPAVLAFVLGGQFHRHYWVILAFPIGTLAGGAVGALRRRAARWIGVAALLVAPLSMTASAMALPRADIGRVLSADGRLTKDERIARWFDRHSDPGDTIYPLCASAGLYGNVSSDPPFPYLWHDPIVNVPGAREALVAMLESDDRPTFVARYQATSSCGLGEQIDAALERHYHRVATIDRIAVLERDGPDAPRP